MASSRRKREPKVSTPEDPTERDFALARLAEARTLAQDAVDELGEAINAVMAGDDPDDDIEAALESLGSASRATEAVEAMTPSINLDETAPWDTEEAEAD